MSKIKLLVAEDESMLLKTLEFRLKKEGYEVVLAQDGKLAKELLYQEEPDMVITDVMMPYITGLELVKIVKEFPTKNIPILVLTTLSQEDTVIKAFELGADDFMTKPFSPNELVMRIKKILLMNRVTISS